MLSELLLARDIIVVDKWYFDLMFLNYFAFYLKKMVDTGHNYAHMDMWFYFKQVFWAANYCIVCYVKPLD